MSAYLGIAYDYFFKDHPQNFLAYLGTISDGAQYFGRLSGRALTIAKNVSKNALLLQTSWDIPLAFQSFRTVYDRYYKIATYEPVKKTDSSETELKEVKKKETPAWLEVSRAISSGVELVDFTHRYILETKTSSFMMTVGALTDLAESGYDLYSHYQKNESEGKKLISLDVQAISSLCHKVSSLFLVALSFVSIYQGVANPTPLLSFLATTVYLGSHFTHYYKAHLHTERRIKIIQD